MAVSPSRSRVPILEAESTAKKPTLHDCRRRVCRRARRRVAGAIMSALRADAAEFKPGASFHALRRDALLTFCDDEPIRRSAFAVACRRVFSLEPLRRVCAALIGQREC